ncbi:MAG: tetratricopeptide repeat protein [Deltaproteobacteria bacterium]|nr:tetratricopeptide repeat protein [Deltaproteobacteria bacterium]MBW2048956.1 tetratricopeptide repeat protein [Deltaproteobacteria bacterium]MBW2111694.1 tetratricopeptide repeat protein [Deltaproteobacteria bacterium]HDZ91014.1 tetratricopeptide repeat protein [Deltaproteobacteria bacterium]
MSYIHQALKKAQIERGDRSEEYARKRAPATGKSRGARRVILILTLFLTILLLAFLAYSWLDSPVPQMERVAPPKRAELEGPAPLTGQKRAPDAEEIYLRGRKLHKEGHLNRAKAWYERALEADPGHVPALNNIGVLLMREKDFAAARARFEKAIRLRPSFVDPYYNLACLFALTARPKEALRYLKRAVSINPEVKAWAREDADLKGLRGHPGFRDIAE